MALSNVGGSNEHPRKLRRSPLAAEGRRPNAYAALNLRELDLTFNQGPATPCVQLVRLVLGPWWVAAAVQDPSAEKCRTPVSDRLGFHGHSGKFRGREHRPGPDPPGHNEGATKSTGVRGEGAPRAVRRNPNPQRI
jgi:hypothetical protein